MTKEELKTMELTTLVKDCIVDCMSLCDQGNIQGCADRMLSTIRQLAIQNEINITEDLCNLTNKITDKFDVRVQKLNNLVEYIETTAWYTDGTGFDTADTLENYIDHIADVERLDEMDRCYIFTKIARDGRIACGAGQIVARGLFKGIEW